MREIIVDVEHKRVFYHISKEKMFFFGLMYWSLFLIDLLEPIFIKLLLKSPIWLPCLSAK